MSKDQSKAVNTRHRIVVAFSLIALVAANLALLTAGLWKMEASTRHREWFSNLVIGLLIGDVALIGVWFGLGDWRWYLRLPVVIALTITTARCFSWAVMLANHGEDRSMMIAFVLLAMTLATAIVAFMLRRLRGWRLTWSAVATASPARQFQLADVMVWTILVSGSLAALKFLYTIDENFSGNYTDLAVYFLESTVLVLFALATAFTKHWSLKTALLILPIVLVIGAAAGIPEMWRVVANWWTAGTTPRPAIRDLLSVCWQVFEYECLAMSAFYSTLLNGLALRVLGGRLIRPTGIVLGVPMQ